MECAEARELLSRSLDGALPSRSEASLMRHLEGCAGCRSFRAALAQQDHVLREAWPAVAAPAGVDARVLAALPPRTTIPGTTGPAVAAPTGVRRRFVAWPALVAAAVALLVMVAVAVPPVRAGLGQLLQTVVLRESDPSVESPAAVRLTRRSLEAQALVPWRIRRPVPPPDGHRLTAVYADEVHSFAAGASVVLEYQRDGAGAPSLRITELQLADPASSPADEPVAPGAARTVTVGGRPGLLIDGEWQTRDGRQQWVRGRLLRLIVEDGDLLLQLEADSRAGWDAERLIAVAASLR